MGEPTIISRSAATFLGACQQIKHVGHFVTLGEWTPTVFRRGLTVTMSWTKMGGRFCVSIWESRTMKPSIPTDTNSLRLRRAGRRLSVLDAMVLVAATAAGLALDRTFWFDTHFWSGARPTRLRMVTGAGIILSVPIAAKWGAAVIGLQLRRPRYRLQRLLWPTGTAAIYAATLGLALGAVLGICAMRGGSINPMSMMIMTYGLPMMAGSVVTAVWTLSMITGKYPAAVDWRDDLGRHLGLYWVVCVVAVGWVLTG